MRPGTTLVVSADAAGRAGSVASLRGVVHPRLLRARPARHGDDGRGRSGTGSGCRILTNAFADGVVKVSAKPSNEKPRLPGLFSRAGDWGSNLRPSAWDARSGAKRLTTGENGEGLKVSRYAGWRHHWPEAMRIPVFREIRSKWRLSGVLVSPLRQREGVGPLSRWGSSDDPQPSGISPPIGSSDREQGEAEDGRSRLRTVPPR